MIDNNDPILSPEETSALLDAMNASEETMGPVEPIDLVSPERRVRNKLLAADRAAEVMAHDFGNTILKHTEALCRVEITPAEIIPFGVMVTNFIPTWSIALLETDNGGFAMAIADATLTSFILDRRLGAPMDSFDEDNEDRVTRSELSPVDQRVLTPVFDDFAAVISANAGAFGAVRLLSVLPNAQALPTTQEHEPLLTLLFTMQPASTPPGRLQIAMDDIAVRRLLPEQELQLSRESTKQEQRAIRAQIMGVDIELTAIFGETHTTIREILQLSVGDILRLDTGRHSEICVKTDNHITLRGTPCVQHGNLGVRITSIAAES